MGRTSHEVSASALAVDFFLDHAREEGTAIPRLLLSLLLVLVAGGCGNAVTDPARSGFEGNPRLIEGDWATLFLTNQGAIRYNGELLPTGGEFLGEFHFFRAGQQVRITFSDGTWDGTRLEFTTALFPGTSIPGPIPWTALYFPAGSTGEGVPARLLLSSFVIGGPGLPIEYVRPSDLDWPETH